MSATRDSCERPLVEPDFDMLTPRYAGANADMDEIPLVRHHLLTGDYVCGAIQTTRGCPLGCSFCSVAGC